MSFGFINAQELASLLRTPGLPIHRRVGPSSNRFQGKQVAVVDVRDDDHEGGHIKGCIHSPSTSFLSGVDQLREKLKDTPVVVFHCALSQVRGPKAARIYAESTKVIRQQDGDTTISQEIYVLRGGFGQFQALYKDQKDLVEDYDSDYY